MISPLILLTLCCCSIFLSIEATEQYYFGVINHQTRWHFHCPYINTKVSTPPSNDQPLISYACPSPPVSMEIVPIEMDLTFLCRFSSRLLWIIVDLYQYNTYPWLIPSDDIDINLELNDRFRIEDRRSEINNHTNRLVIIHAFYIPFESMDRLWNQSISINIDMKNSNQLNRCQFSVRDSSSWQTWTDTHCNSSQSKTLHVRQATCHFRVNEFVHRKTMVTLVRISLTRSSRSTSLRPSAHSDEPVAATSAVTLPDTNLILSVDEERSTPETNATTSLSPLDYHQHYLLFEENYHKILTSLLRSRANATLLKLTFIFLVLILIVLVVFFLYMLCYHYQLRARSLSSVQQSPLSI